MASPAPPPEPGGQAPAPTPAPPAGQAPATVAYGPDGRPIGYAAAPVAPPAGQPPQGAPAAADYQRFPPGYEHLAAQPAPPPAKTPLVTPGRVAIGAIALVLGILLAVVFRPAPSGPVPLPPPPVEAPPEVVRLEQENADLRDRVRELKQEHTTLMLKRQRLGGPQSLSQPLDWAARLARAGLSSRLGFLAMAAPLVAPAIAEVAATSPNQPQGPGYYEQRRLELLREQEELKNQIAMLESRIAELQGGNNRVEGFDQSDLVLMDRDQGAVAIVIDGDDYTVTAKALAGDMDRVITMVKKSGRARLTSNGNAVRRLKRLDPGERVTDKSAINAIEKLFRPRAYVPESADEDEMVAFKPRRGRGQDRYVIGYVVEKSDEPPSMKVATLDGVEEYGPRDLIDPPLFDNGESLLVSEPRIDFFDYALLQVARKLNTPEKAVYQRVALKTDIALNKGYYRQLSDYSAEKNIGWLGVSKQDEDRALRGVQNDLVGQQLLMERVAAGVDRYVEKRAADLGLPIVVRDKRVLLDLLQEQAIAGDARPVESLEKELRVMQAAAERGNLPYAEIDYEGTKRRVFYNQDDEQRFREFEEAMGGSSWVGTAANAGVAIAADAYGYGYGYGGGGGYRRGPGGGAFGFGGGGGGGGAGIGVGAGVSASFATEDFLYRDGRVYQSEGNQSTRATGGDDTDANRYRSVTFAEQAAKRDAALSIEDYGRLAAASHVLKVMVEEGSSPGELAYKVDLYTAEGDYLWGHSEEMPISPRPLAKTSYLASGQLFVLNPEERGRRKSQAHLSDGPRKLTRNGKLPPLVIERPPTAKKGEMVFRSLFTAEPVTVDRDTLVLTGASEERCGRLRLDDKSSFSEVPFDQKLRCVVLKLLEAVAPKAGEVIAVDPSTGTAKARLIDANKTWESDQRLRAKRPPEGDYTLAAGASAVPLPIDVIADRLGSSLVNLRFRSNSWGEATLRVGDRLVARDAEEPLVFIEATPYFRTRGIRQKEFWKMRREEWHPDVPGYDENSTPDREALDKVFTSQLGWNGMERRLDEASTRIEESLRDALISLDVPTTTNRSTGTGPTHVVTLYLKPISTGTVRLGVKVVAPTVSPAPIMHITPEVRIDHLTGWEP